jgi:predicted hotdog family 3-hydroxylacyl-ACP dehydratase
MAIHRPELNDYLPHADAMCLLTRIMDYDLAEYRLVSEVDVAETSLFYRESLGGMPAWVGFEYMAQSISALSGLKRRAELDQGPRIGFIMSVRGFETGRPAYPAGSVQRAEVRQIFRDGSVVSFECSLSDASGAHTKAIVNAIEMDEADRPGGQHGD